MTATANEKKVQNLAGKEGFDEMSIQRDLQLDSRAGETRLCGSVNMGKEGNALDRCRGVDEKSGKVNNTTLASNVLQMEFLGFSGFVFPFAHFATVGVQAHHLVCLFWKAIGHLYDYGFNVHFCLFDGASANRSFLKLLFHPLKPLDTNMTIDNLHVMGETVVLGMDVKHVIKRIRNNIFNSGVTSLCTRHLHWRGFPIIWDHWRCAFNWDITCNPEMTRLHHKLSKEHIFLNTVSKMRNHLAEECLNSAMWSLMKSYADTVSEGQRKSLTGTLKFLSITSDFISFVNNDYPLVHLADSRFSTLELTMSFFSDWETEVVKNSVLDNATKKSYLMSQETREDVMFACTSLREIFKKRVTSGNSVFFRNRDRRNMVPIRIRPIYNIRKA